MTADPLTPEEVEAIRDRMDVWGDYGPDPTSTILSLIATLDAARSANPGGHICDREEGRIDVLSGLEKYGCRQGNIECLDWEDIGTADPGGLRETALAVVDSGWAHHEDFVYVGFDEWAALRDAVALTPEATAPLREATARGDALAAEYRRRLTPEATAPDADPGGLRAIWRGFASGKDASDPKVAETWALAEEWVRHCLALTPEATATTCPPRECDLGNGHEGRCWWASGTDDD